MYLSWYVCFFNSIKQICKQKETQTFTRAIELHSLSPSLSFPCSRHLCHDVLASSVNEAKTKADRHVQDAHENESTEKNENHSRSGRDHRSLIGQRINTLVKEENEQTSIHLSKDIKKRKRKKTI